MSEQTNRSAHDVANLVDEFVLLVSSWISAKDIENITVSTENMREYSDRTFGSRWVAMSKKTYEIAAQIRNDGPTLATAIESYGHDSTIVLTIVYCAGPRGGGATYAFKTWPENKVLLQRTAIILRKPSKLTLESSPKQQLSKPASIAYKQYQIAVEENQNAASPIMTDQEAYSFVADKLNNGICDKEVTLPHFDTWARQLREARKHYKEPKNQPRGGRTSPSVVANSDL